MLNLNKSNFQAHPFHLVSPSTLPTTIRRMYILSVIKFLFNRIGRYSTIKISLNKSTLTLFIFKYIPIMPYIYMLLSISYTLFKLFLCFDIDGHIIKILLDFNSNFSPAFDFDMDNTVYSSGNSNHYDPIRDTFIERENPTNPPTNDPLSTTHRSHTTQLADFLEPKADTGHTLYSAELRFQRTSQLSMDSQYYSKILYCVREQCEKEGLFIRQGVHVFKHDGGSTRVTGDLVNFIRGLDRDYDLDRVSRHFF
jgi:hypothetical protein